MTFLWLTDDTRQRLLQDPVIWDMAAGIRRADVYMLMDPDGSPTRVFSAASDLLYERSGGEVPKERDAVARTLLCICTAPPEQVILMWSPPARRRQEEHEAHAFAAFQPHHRR